MEQHQYAPGRPGIEPRWSSSAKSGIGTALDPRSTVWFTISHGILNEIFYPRLDYACTRDMGLLITGPDGYFSEEKRHTHSEVQYIARGTPAYRLTNTAVDGRYRIEKEIITDPHRDVVLQRSRFIPLQGELADYHVYVILAPHLGNRGSENNAWVGDYKGQEMLFAERDSWAALALASDTPWLGRSAGFVGVSDGWQDLSQHKAMTWFYSNAERGNVALTGEIDLAAHDGSFVLALGFDGHAFAAAHKARASLFDGFDLALDTYTKEWEDWQNTLLSLDEEHGDHGDHYRVSTIVLRVHESKQFHGGMIASLSIPWGFSKGDDDLGGYHLVWARDQVEAVGGLIAVGAGNEARRVLRYLRVTQEADGHWPQNMWLDGTPYWNGIQLDEAGLPILLAAQAWREGAVDTERLETLWPMISRAAGYIVRNGPVTQQDRWEENAGYSPFTLAIEVSALLAAAALAEHLEQPAIARYLRETADNWNANIENWTYATGTALAREHGVNGYYVRIASPSTLDDPSTVDGQILIKNRPAGEGMVAAESVVSPDALALVRFGLRDPNDPRILNTIKVIDAVLKVDTPSGPSWKRYNGDGYGEHADGSPFDSAGLGRAWPLLTGERAHYELAAGHVEEAWRLMHAMEAFAGDGCLIPEQIWDAPDIPERELFFAHPSGSAMPLVWAHAEYLKLRRSLREGRIFDLPPEPVQRYQVEHVGTTYTVWRFIHQDRTSQVGRTLRLEVLAPAHVRWSADNWQTFADLPTHDTGIEAHIVDLPTADLPVGTTVTFTFWWTETNHWEGTNFEVHIRPPYDQPSL